MIKQDSANRFMAAANTYQDEWKKAAEGLYLDCYDLTRAVQDDQANLTNYFFLMMTREALLKSSQQMYEITGQFYAYVNSIRSFRIANIEPLPVVVDEPTQLPPQDIANYSLQAANDWETFRDNLLRERQTIESAMDAFRNTYLSLRDDLQDGTVVMLEIDRALSFHWSDVYEYLQRVKAAAALAADEAADIRARYAGSGTASASTSSGSSAASFAPAQGNP